MNEIRSTGNNLLLRERIFLSAHVLWQGEEFYQPGSTAQDHTTFRTVHNWIQLKLIYDTYFKERGRWRLAFTEKWLILHSTSSTIIQPPC